MKTYRLGVLDWDEIDAPLRGENLQDYAQELDAGKIDKDEAFQRKPLHTAMRCLDPGCRYGNIHIHPDRCGPVEMVIHLNSPLAYDGELQQGSLACYPTSFGADRFIEGLKASWESPDLNIDDGTKRRKDLTVIRLRCKVAKG